MGDRMEIALLVYNHNETSLISFDGRHKSVALVDLVGIKKIPFSQMGKDHQHLF